MSNTHYPKPVQLSLEDYRRDLIRKEMERLARLDHWDCSVCGRRVSRDSSNHRARIQRPGGYDHARCHPGIK